MANTYSQIYIQVVFAVKNREASINTLWEEDLYKYITGIITNKGQKLIAINGTSNHIHIFMGIKPDINLSDLIKEIKRCSTNHIREKRWCRCNFQWQHGFGAFSYGHSQISSMVKYIHEQKEHHKKQSFKEEYMTFLKLFDIPHKSEYLFDWNED